MSDQTSDKPKQRLIRESEFEKIMGDAKGTQRNRREEGRLGGLKVIARPDVRGVFYDLDEVNRQRISGTCWTDAQLKARQALIDELYSEGTPNLKDREWMWNPLPEKVFIVGALTHIEGGYRAYIVEAIDGFVFSWTGNSRAVVMEDEDGIWVPVVGEEGHG